MTVIQLKTTASQRAENIVAALESLLESARAGRPSTLACIMTHDNGDIETGIYAASAFELIGSVEVLKFTLLDAHMEDDE